MPPQHRKKARAGAKRPALFLCAAAALGLCASMWPGWAAAAQTPPSSAEPAPGWLLPSPPSEARLLSFTVMSDLHVQSGDASAASRLRAALHDLETAYPESGLLILNGDLTDGDPEDFAELNRLLGERPHPELHAAIGNHEYYRMWRQPDGSRDYRKLSSEWTSRAAVEQFQAFFGYREPYHALWTNGHLFLFLGGEAYRDELPDIGEAAWLTQRQLAWLRLALERHARHNRGRPVFLFLHQPLPGTVDGSGLEAGVVPHEELRRILDAHPEAIVFSGHTHWDVETTDQLWGEGPRFLGSGSVRQVWTGDNRPSPEAKSQSLAVDVYADRIVVRGREHIRRRWTQEHHLPLHSDER